MHSPFRAIEGGYSTTSPGFVHTRYYVTESQCTPGSAQPSYIYSSAAQRSALRCRAVRCRAFCPALRCCVVLPCALFRTFSNVRYETKYQVSGAGMYMLCTRILAFSSVDLSVSNFSPHANYTRTADQNVTPPTSTQHSTGQLALHLQLLASPIRCSHQIMGLFFLPPLHVLVAFFLARA